MFAVSGGVDTLIGQYSVTGFITKDHPILWSPFPHTPSLISFAPDHGLLLSQHARTLNLWQIGSG